MKSLLLSFFVVGIALNGSVAFAAASITKADPMKTGFSAVRSGIVMFTIPFVFALYPELLLIDKAVIDPNNGLFLAGYDGSHNFGWLALLMLRIAVALYLVSSALARFDVRAISSSSRINSVTITWAVTAIRFCAHQILMQWQLRA